MRVQGLPYYTEYTMPMSDVFGLNPETLVVSLDVCFKRGGMGDAGREAFPVGNGGVPYLRPC